jgi:hypothetical protein
LDHTPPFQKPKQLGILATMASAAPQAIDLVMDSLANASE